MIGLEILARDFPLHYQRILEECHKHNPSLRNHLEQDRFTSTAKILEMAFVWEDSSEGHDYWSALNRGARR